MLGNIILNVYLFCVMAGLGWFVIVTIINLI